MESISFKQIVYKLEDFWKSIGCDIILPYDMEMGAATFHPTVIKTTSLNQDSKFAFVQPCRRPQDARSGINPNRLYKFHQFQVILSPTPSNIQSLLIDSLIACGVNPCVHDIDFREDNWCSPSIGATGKGYEVRCNNMEVCQFTYFQQMGGKSLTTVPIELAYGLERLAYIIQGKEHIFDLIWDIVDNKKVTYGHHCREFEKEYSRSKYSMNDLINLFNLYESMTCNTYIGLYEIFLKLCSIFNCIEGTGLLSSIERTVMLNKVRRFANKAIWREFYE